LYTVVCPSSYDCIPWYVSDRCPVPAPLHAAGAGSHLHLLRHAAILTKCTSTRRATDGETIHLLMILFIILISIYMNINNCFPIVWKESDIPPPHNALRTSSFTLRTAYYLTLALRFCVPRTVLLRTAYGINTP